MKKKKPVIIEYRYIGELPFPSWRVWHKYSSYRDENTAQMAMDNIRKKSVNFEFRVKPKELT